MTPERPAHALDLSADQLRATARATAERDLAAADLALRASLDLAGLPAGREWSAIADALTLIDAARRRIHDADRLARRRVSALNLPSKGR